VGTFQFRYSPGGPQSVRVDAKGAIMIGRFIAIISVLTMAASNPALTRRAAVGPWIVPSVGGILILRDDGSLSITDKHSGPSTGNWTVSPTGSIVLNVRAPASSTLSARLQGSDLIISLPHGPDVTAIRPRRGPISQAQPNDKSSKHQ
jgi:hypothetical protein